MMQRMVIRLRSENLDDIHSDLGVKIHGYIMSIIDSDYAEKLHTEALNPFSINVVRDGSELILTINALADEAMQIINALKAVDKIIVKGAPALKVLDYSIENPVGYNDYVDNIKKYQFNIITPALCKKQGTLYFGTEISQYFKSVALKLNEFENENISEEDIKKAFDCMKIVGYKFFSKSYKIAPKKLTGMMGSVSFKIHGDYSNCELLKKLIHYSCYSGIGSRTALGMGGAELNMFLV